MIIKMYLPCIIGIFPEPKRHHCLIYKRFSSNNVCIELIPAILLFITHMHTMYFNFAQGDVENMYSSSMIENINYAHL